MTERQIYITRHDMERLRNLIEVYTENTGLLEDMLDRARIVLPNTIPHDVVTMNSIVRVRDIDTGEERTFTLVFPGTKADNGAVSILAPAGTSLIGRRENDIVERHVPSGKRRMQIVAIVYQPERAGEYDV